jgi:hypothetical protein
VIWRAEKLLAHWPTCNNHPDMKLIYLFSLVALCLSVSGSPLDKPKRVTPAEFGEAKQPQVAISGDGMIHVAFGKGDAIYATRSSDTGDSFSEPVKVGELPKLALGMRRGPRIATAGRSVVLTGISHEDGNLHSWRSDDRGHSWSKRGRINTVAKSAIEGLHGLASDGERKIAAVWLDLRSGKTELWASVSNDEGKTWATDTRVYRSPDLTICECCHPSVAFTSSGKIVVMWRNFLNGSRDIYRAESSDDGKSFSVATKLGTGTWKLQACPMDGGSLAADGDRIAYAWRRDRTLLVTTDPASETVLSESGTQPVAVRTAEGFAILWQDGGNLYWRFSGAAEKDLFSAGAAFAAAGWNPRQRSSTVVWEGSDGIFARTVQ